MAYQYVVSSQKPTSVTHAVKGHFVSRDVPTLVVVKVSRLEAHQVTEDGLEPLLDVAVNARIATVDCLPVQVRTPAPDCLACVPTLCGASWNPSCATSCAGRRPRQAPRRHGAS